MNETGVLVQHCRYLKNVFFNSPRGKFAIPYSEST
jgi:hypothetical protein